MKLFTRIILILFFSCTLAYSYTDQLTSERILKENRYFLDIMDTSLTNFQDAKREGEFKDIYTMHFNAFVAFLQSDYKRTYHKVYDSQKKQADLYADLVSNLYLENSKDLLDRMAPFVIKSKNTKAKLYLTLGYRDYTIAHNQFVMASASNPKQHSYKIYKYIQSIKKTRRAKRYGLLALFESQNNDTKRTIYNKLFEDEKKSGTLFFNRFLGKAGDEYLNEMNKEFTEKESKGAETPESNQNVQTTELTRQNEITKNKYERRVEQRVRFKNEKRVAEYLFFYQFDQSNDIIIKYIDDFHFKLIQASLEVLAGNSKDSKEGLDYSALKLHHTDNYARLTRESLLKTFIDTLKVEDDIKKSEYETTSDESAAIKKENLIKEAEKDAKEIKTDVKNIEKTETK